MRSIKFLIQFLKINDKVPFIDWLESLDKEIQLRIRNRLTWIELGNIGNTKPLRDGIYELRFHFNSGYRIYYGKEDSRIIILINGGNKGN